MSVSLIYRNEQDPPRPPQPRPVLLTGAGGRVGRWVAKALAARSDLALRLMIENESQRERVGGCGEIVMGDIRDALSIRPAFEGIDTVVHLAANPSTRAAWTDLQGPNISGLYNVLEAAVDAGCRKVVLASSVNAVTGSALQDRPIDEEQPIAPGNLYGATKALAEAVGRVFAQDQGLSVLCVRLGGMISPDTAASDRLAPGMKRVAISYDDVCQFFTRCVDDETVRFGVFHAMSEADGPLMSIDRARAVLGFHPRHKLTPEGFIDVSNPGGEAD